ncbi:carbohydrate kinase family protein [Roseiconus nitratireducens]|uniref:Carbohydrate kinase family protein n=1 Tax=Roseiconus nitratireducens TaxID=2605748 RepID=A0A5M6CXG8_9BACT|nr:carbohydrate kinase family protein [Roseiconus nitratireducens]KAA5539918.1 carbohydrate kinase family protein [Roseiconus nitratireducens]
MQQPCDVVGIGVTVWDSLFLIDRRPECGEVVRASERMESFGGGVAVAVATAARLGTTAAMIDSLGTDTAGDHILGQLHREGVETQDVQRIPGASSSVASIWSERATGERTIVFSPGTAADRLEWNESIQQRVRHAKVLHLNGRHLPACIQAAATARSCSVPVSFDGGAYRHRPEILPLLAASDWVIVARQFAQQHFRYRRNLSAENLSAADLASFLLADLNCEIVGVTSGPEGSALIRKGGHPIHQPAIGVERAVDTTGCGDTYHGAFLHGYLRTGDLSPAARTAAEVSGANAQHLGALAFQLGQNAANPESSSGG